MIAQAGDGPLPAYRRPVAEVVAGLAADAQRGLEPEAGAQGPRRYGRNELPAPPKVPAWRHFLAQFRDTLTILLLVATFVSLVAWWIERESPIPYEALTIVAIVIANGVLGVVQESRAEHAIAALGAMSAPSARVLRGGQQQSVATAEVVPGDVLLIGEGDTIPADARVLESIALRAAESALTGESTSVSKDSAPLGEESGIADQSNMVFSGTAISSGRGRAIVTATGADTEIGKIARSLAKTEQTATPLQKELDRVGKLLGIAVIAIAVVVGATILLVEHLSSISALVDVLLVAVSLAVAAVPEGLTAITTVVLSLGTQRMAKRNVIVRRLSSVETLGSTTTICSDKTGTLTRNEMTVRAVVTASGKVELTGAGYEPSGEVRQDGKPVSDRRLLEEVEKTLSAGDLANNAALVEKDGRATIQGDPTEGALVVAARKVGRAASESRRRFRRVREVPFSSERKLMSTVHADAEVEGRTMVFAKGAPDVLLARCTEAGGRGHPPAHTGAAGGDLARDRGPRKASAAHARDRLPRSGPRSARRRGARPGSAGRGGDDRSAAAGGEAVGRPGEDRGRAADHDHGRPSGNGGSHRHRAGDYRIGGAGHYRIAAREDAGRGASLAGARGLRLRARGAGAQATDRRRAASERRDRRHDGRRRERRSRAEGGRHRRGDGNRGHRRGEGRGGHDPHRRQLRFDSCGGRGRPVDLRQHPALPALPALVEHRRGAGDVLRGGACRDHRPRARGRLRGGGPAARDADPLDQSPYRFRPCPGTRDGAARPRGHAGAAAGSAQPGDRGAGLGRDRARRRDDGGGDSRGDGLGASGGSHRRAAREHGRAQVRADDGVHDPRVLPALQYVQRAVPGSQRVPPDVCEPLAVARGAWVGSASSRC